MEDGVVGAFWMRVIVFLWLQEGLCIVGRMVSLGKMCYYGVCRLLRSFVRGCL